MLVSMITSWQICAGSVKCGNFHADFSGVLNYNIAQIYILHSPAASQMDSLNDSKPRNHILGVEFCTAIDLKDVFNTFLISEFSSCWSRSGVESFGPVRQVIMMEKRTRSVQRNFVTTAAAKTYLAFLGTETIACQKSGFDKFWSSLILLYRHWKHVTAWTHCNPTWLQPDWTFWDTCVLTFLPRNCPKQVTYYIICQFNHIEFILVILLCLRKLLIFPLVLRLYIFAFC